MEAYAGKAFQVQIIFDIFPRISLHWKLVPVQYWEYEYGLFADWFRILTLMRVIVDKDNNTFFI